MVKNSLCGLFVKLVLDQIMKRYQQKQIKSFDGPKLHKKWKMAQTSAQKT